MRRGLGRPLPWPGCARPGRGERRWSAYVEAREAPALLRPTPGWEAGPAWRAWRGGPGERAWPAVGVTCWGVLLQPLSARGAGRERGRGLRAGARKGSPGGSEKGVSWPLGAYPLKKSAPWFPESFPVNNNKFEGKELCWEREFSDHKTAGVLIPTLLFISCLTLNYLLKLSFSLWNCKMRIIIVLNPDGYHLKNAV